MRPRAIWGRTSVGHAGPHAVPAGMPVSAAAAADTVPIGRARQYQRRQHLRRCQLVERIYRPARDPQVDTVLSAWLCRCDRVSDQPGRSGRPDAQRDRRHAGGCARPARVPWAVPSSLHSIADRLHTAHRCAVPTPPLAGRPSSYINAAPRAAPAASGSARCPMSRRSPTRQARGPASPVSACGSHV